MPAAQTVMVEPMRLPLAVTTLSAVTSTTFSPVCTSIASLRSSRTAAWPRRSGNCESRRGAASIKHDLQVGLRVDVVEAVAGQHPRRGMQLGRQFHARGATADDGHGQARAIGLRAARFARGCRR